LAKKLKDYFITNPYIDIYQMAIGANYGFNTWFGAIAGYIRQRGSGYKSQLKPLRGRITWGFLF